MVSSPLIAIPVPAVATRPARSSSDPSSWEGEGEEGGGEGGGGGGTVDAEEPVADQRPGEVFVKSFVFHPNLPIRIDYMGKRFQNEAMVGMSIVCSKNFLYILLPLPHSGYPGWHSDGPQSSGLLRSHTKIPFLQERVCFIYVVVHIICS